MRRPPSPVVLGLLLACGEAPDSDVDPVDTRSLPEVCDPATVAHRPLRRRTATRLDQALDDLTGVEEDWSDGLPPEGGGHEQDGATQSLGPAHVEGWSAVASRAAETLVERTPRGARWEAEEAGWTVGRPHSLATEPDATWWALDVDASQPPLRLPMPVEVPAEGTWVLGVRAVWSAGWEYGMQGPALRVVGDHLPTTASQAITGEFEDAEWITWEVALEAGRHDLTLEVLPTLEIQGIAIDRWRIDGPLEDLRAGDSPARAAFVPCDPLVSGDLPCARRTLEPLARRAWRRPPTDAELDRLEALVQLALDDDLGFDEGLALAIRAVLLSPHFLLIAPVDGMPAPGEVRAATSHELADRLADLLWASLPDDELLDCADAGLLRPDPTAEGACALATQVARMLQDPRSDAAVRDWTRQWLGLDDLALFEPDASLDVAWDDDTPGRLAEAVYARVGASRDQPLTRLLTSREGFVDDVVGPLQGTGGGTSLEPERLPVERAGVLTEPAVLTLTSQPARTSPVVRGQWVLTRLLCAPADPPPPNVPALPAEVTGTSPRDVLAQHRADPACAGCHDDLDPPGLALEGFDPVGRWRERYPDGEAVDTRGGLPDGTEVSGARALAEVLAEREDVQDCITGHLVAFGLARALQPSDACLLGRVDSLGGADEASLDELLTVLAISADTLAVAGPDAEAP